jgi:hypothetical protein|tara:strand:+ start:334 stop:561 length:228 start_codon:yes stop_codon:yes gene_type:complete
MEYNLVPITRLKITKEKWLNTPIKYEEDMKVKDIVDDMAYKSYEWINMKSDLDVVTDYNTFKKDFINLMYDKYQK